MILARVVGTVVATRKDPRLEGKKLLHNMMTQAYTMLYIDYGPPIPDFTDVQPSVHLGQIRSPDFADPIQLTLIPGGATDEPTDEGGQR